MIHFTEEDIEKIELKDDENPTYMDLLMLYIAGKISNYQRYRLCQLMEEGYIISPYARFRMDGFKNCVDLARIIREKAKKVKE